MWKYKLEDIEPMDTFGLYLANNPSSPDGLTLVLTGDGDVWSLGSGVRVGDIAHFPSVSFLMEDSEEVLKVRGGQNKFNEWALRFFASVSLFFTAAMLYDLLAHDTGYKLDAYSATKTKPRPSTGSLSL